ncbi:histone-like nucleoid-structuring protein Lsr2 [Nocardia sp. CA-120079]|uniref:histone-like nucleoid-structuring protein Lsr2 n=1 Tax=Nocardia sp. CA-120079 TaxID=3239974 RepID=UPI003D968304
MARKVVVTLVDDFDGKSAAEETVAFALDGVEYEIDLSTINAGQLRGIFEPWASSARRIGRAARGKSQTSRTANDRARTVAIRDWARAKGIAVSARGRISAEVAQAYEKANA